LLTLDEAQRLAATQASAFQRAGISEQIASEDVRQARAAFRPKVTAPGSYIYTSPAIDPPPGTPREQSFINANAISEYLALMNVEGDVDISGRLRAALARSRADLEAAHAGTEVARRELARSVVEAYYGLVLARALTRAAQQNLDSAEQFQQVTALLFSGGEVAAVDVTRAELQTLTRRDEMEKARANEVVAVGALQVLVGYDFSRPVNVIDFILAVPDPSELQRFSADTVSRRPELLQFDAEHRAAEQEIKLARAERLPQLSYSLSGGFDADSLKAPRLKQHTGAAGAFNLTVPIFDWGASRSRERQARLRAQSVQSERSQALRTFGQDFYAARAQATSASARIRLAQEAVAKAQDNLSASIARYRSGEAQIVEVTDAQTTLAAARAALYQALFDYQIALAHLRQATGQ